MPGQHKSNPISFRPGTKPGDPDGDRQWLQDYAKATGMKPGAIISEAVAEYRQRHATATAAAPARSRPERQEQHQRRPV